MKGHVKERDKAFRHFVLTGDETPVMAYCMKYHVPVPTNASVLAAGIYKAVQEISTMPDDIKALAREKCIALGFKPTMGGY